jgi:hypothetical protein
MSPASNTAATSQHASSGMSSTSDTTASSHQATPGMAHTAGTAGHSDRLGLVFRTAPSHEFGHKATAAARAVSGHALVDALLVALLVAFLGFAAAETHVDWLVGWLGYVCWCKSLLGLIDQLR